MPRPRSSSNAPAASSTIDRARASSASSAAIRSSRVGGARPPSAVFLDLDDDVVVAGGPQGLKFLARAPRRVKPPRELRRAVPRRSPALISASMARADAAVAARHARIAGNASGRCRPRPAEQAWKRVVLGEDSQRRRRRSYDVARRGVVQVRRRRALPKTSSVLGMPNSGPSRHSALADEARHCATHAPSCAT